MTTLNLIRSVQWGLWRTSTGRPAQPKGPVFTTQNPRPGRPVRTDLLTLCDLGALHSQCGLGTSDGFCS